jgi:hypothetical protein
VGVRRIKKMLVLKRYRGTAVSEELFDPVQERIAKTPRTGNRRVCEYALAAGMLCSGCDRHLHGVAIGGYTARMNAKGERVRYHRPERRQRYYVCFICLYRLNAEKLEEAFFEKKGDLDADDAMLQPWIDSPPLRTRERAAAKDVAHLEAQSTEGEEKKRRDLAFDIALEARFGEAELRRQLERITTDFAARCEPARAIREGLVSNAAAERTVAHARNLLRSFQKIYAAATYEQKREIVAAVAEALGGLTVAKDGLRWTREPEAPLNRPVVRKRSRSKVTLKRAPAKRNSGRNANRNGTKV